MTTHLRQLRKEQGLTQRQVAERAGLDIQRISIAERSLDPRRISAGSLLPIAKVLGVSPDSLITEPLTV